MYDNFLVRTDSLENFTENGKIAGFKFAIRLANYRGIYLSLVNDFYVNMDGKEYSRKDFRLELNGKAPRTLDETRKTMFEHWDMQKEAYLYVNEPGGLKEGMHKLGYLSSDMSNYGYQAHDQEWLENPPKPGQGGGYTSRVCWFDLPLKA